MGVIKALKGLGKAYTTYQRNKSSKKLFSEASGGLQHPVIKSFKPKKNLTKRREDFEAIVKAVERHGKSSKASKIKYDAAKKVSNIHTKYEKLKKIHKK